MPEIEKPPPPPPEKKKLATKPPVPPPPPKSKSAEEETKAPGNTVKPRPPAPPAGPKAKKPEKPKVEGAGVKSTKETSSIGTLFKVAAAFIFVAALFVGAIYLITIAFTSETGDEQEPVAQEMTPSAPTTPIKGMQNAVGNINNPYTDPDSSFGEIYMDPNSPFAEPTDTEEPSPSITRDARPSISKDPRPAQPLPSEDRSEELFTEETSTPEEITAPPPIVQKPTPDPAVVDYLNSLVVGGVKPNPPPPRHS